MAINRDRTAYHPKTQAFVKAIAQVFLNGDEDAAWERYFKEADEVASQMHIEIDPSSPTIIMKRSRSTKT
jgi:hypothetical protein